MDAITMIQSDEVNVRLETEVADSLGYERVSKIYDVRDASGDTIEVAHYKAYITNVPFFKENQLDYEKWLPKRWQSGNYVLAHIRAAGDSNHHRRVERRQFDRRIGRPCNGRQQRGGYLTWGVRFW